MLSMHYNNVHKNQDDIDPKMKKTYKFLPSAELICSI